MADRCTIEQGIRYDRGGIEAYVRIGGKNRSKRFAPDTPLETVRLWRNDQKRGLQDERRFRALQATEDQQRRLLKKTPDGWCYVYFIRIGPYIKIGRTTDIAMRLATFQTGTPHKPVLLVAVLAHASLERLVHSCFEDARHDREWFALTPRLETYIRLLRDGINPLPFLFDEPLASASTCGADVSGLPSHLSGASESRPHDTDPPSTASHGRGTAE